MLHADPYFRLLHWRWRWLLQLRLLSTDQVAPAPAHRAGDASTEAIDD